MTQSNGNPKGLLYVVIGLVVIGLGLTVYFMKMKEGAAPEGIPTEATPTATDSPAVEGDTTATPTATESPAAGAAKAVDLNTDDRGLSHATVTITTNKGVIKYKFYSKDAPNTVKRMVELIQSGFYNGLIFHRVEPGFVVQGGDPEGQGYGGSGQKLKAEFNSRKHVAGTLAMARAQDPDSADSQFYISLGTHPHLDNQYTVFGQVVEGLDVARKIEVGDKMTMVTVE